MVSGKCFISAVHLAINDYLIQVFTMVARTNGSVWVHILPGHLGVEKLSSGNWTDSCYLEDVSPLIQEASSFLKNGCRVPGIYPPGGVGGAEADALNY